MRFLPLESLLFIMLLSMMPGSCVFASSPAKDIGTDYGLRVKDSRALWFIMRAPDVPYRKPSEQELRTNEEYPKSGLYRVPKEKHRRGKRTPLWSLDWYERRERVELSSNGWYLMRIVYSRNKKNEISLIFYKAGQEIKRYKMSDLGLPPLNSALVYGVARRAGPQNTMAVDIYRYEIPSYTRERTFVGGFVFDMRTGAIRSLHRYKGAAWAAANSTSAQDGDGQPAGTVLGKSTREPARRMENNNQPRSSFTEVVRKIAPAVAAILAILVTGVLVVRQKLKAKP